MFVRFAVNGAFPPVLRFLNRKRLAAFSGYQNQIKIFHLARESN
jgi:hypothetical protein